MRACVCAHAGLLVGLFFIYLFSMFVHLDDSQVSFPPPPNSHLQTSQTTAYLFNGSVWQVFIFVPKVPSQYYLLKVTFFFKVFSFSLIAFVPFVLEMACCGKVGACWRH